MQSIHYAMLVAVLTATACWASPQSVTVKGRLLCGENSTTSKDTWVKVLNKKIGFDDQVEISVNDNGTFEITLNVERAFTLTPELHIYTDCNDAVFYGTIEKGCQRKIKIEDIPEKYISTPNSKKPACYIGEYNLELKFHEESRDCSVKRTVSG